MGGLHCMRETAAFFFLVLWTTSDSSIVATCNKSEDAIPIEWHMHHEFNPSPLHELTVELNESQSSVIIRWSINIDSSIRSLTGTWILLNVGEYEYHYRCQYQPPFTSEQISLTGQEQLWFSFTVPNIPVCPSTSYVSAYNLPTPSEAANEYAKMATAEVQWKADIYSVLHGDKIVVSFNTSLVADRHNIQLRNRTHLLKAVEGRGECKVEKCDVELEYMEYMGPCEDLMIMIVADFKHCQAGRQEKHQKVVCPNRSSLDIGVGCVLALLFVLLCCCITYQIFRRARGSRRAGSVRALLVYPAVDGVFQRSVMLLAERLQSCGGVSVVIDVWERGSLAEQGPLRWINSQADLAERVLIVSPPPRTQTGVHFPAEFSSNPNQTHLNKFIKVFRLLESYWQASFIKVGAKLCRKVEPEDDLKSKLIPGVPDDTVSASASNLFALALNLVTSAAHDPHGRDKFWVISLDRDEKSVQTELRGCRTFVLPRDLKKLHRQLLSGAVRSPALPRCFRSFYCKNALEQLEINTDFPSCACQSDSLDKNPHLLS